MRGGFIKLARERHGKLVGHLAFLGLLAMASAAAAANMPQSRASVPISPAVPLTGPAHSATTLRPLQWFDSGASSARLGRNRVYLAADYFQAERWAKLLPAEDAEPLIGFDFTRSDLLAVFYASPIRTGIGITGVSLEGATLLIDLWAGPGASQACTVYRSPAHCGPTAYSIVAVPKSFLRVRPGRLLVRSQETAGERDAASYTSELGVPVTIDPGVEPQLTPRMVFQVVTDDLLTPLSRPGNRIASIEATAQIPAGFAATFLTYLRPIVWKVRLLGVYPGGAPACPPPGGCQALPPYVNPTLILPDVWPSGWMLTS